jgi:hypothetical protein
MMNRKSTIFLPIVFALLALTAAAQPVKKNKTESNSGSGSKCFDESSKIIGVGLGFWGSGYYRYGKNGAYTYRSSPAFCLTYEQSLPKLGPGYLGLGAYFGYKTASYKYDDWYYNGNKYYYRHNWTYMFIAARGAYHAEALMTDKAELYFGAVVGLRIQKYNFETNSIDPERNAYELHESNIYPGYSLFLGGRYYLSNNIGLYAELGYGISYLTAGLSFKF